MTSPAAGSLNGLTVLDLTRLLPGPFCSMILADHGARVIHIEPVTPPPTPDGGVTLATLHRNKQHLRLDLKTAAGQAILHRLVKGADVLLEGFRPGVSRRLGADYDTLRPLNPAIIYCSLTGYGQEGARRGWAGHDLNYLATAGALELFGRPGDPAAGHPRVPALQIADIAGGSQNAVIGILLALLHRERTGAGQAVEIAMVDGLLSTLAIPFSQLQAGLPHRAGESFLSGTLACYDVYRTRDGQALAVAALEPVFFRNLCALLGIEDWAPRQYDPDGQAELRGVLQDRFATRTLAEWRALPAPEDLCTTAAPGLAAALADPELRRRGMVTSVRAESGEEIPLLGIPVRLSASPGRIHSPPPGPGEHTDAILEEVGYAADEIVDLRKAGVIG